VFIDQAQQMVLWNLIFQSEVIKQRFRAGVWRSTAACPNYAAKHLASPYGFPGNQLIRIDFFNTYACLQQLRILDTGYGSVLAAGGELP
jgi:hypothetical protein